MPTVDYFVATMPYDDHVQALYPRVFAEYADECPRNLYGYRMFMKDGIGIGLNYDHTRVMVIGTSDKAHSAMAMVSVLSPFQVSVARIDVQVTFVVGDADRDIAWIQPDKKYKAVRWSAVHEKGSTLYVGAPSSDARLRIYNKTAESGNKPDDGGEYMRVEVQLRNRYADLAYRHILDGKIEGVWQKWVRQMLHPDDASGIILKALGSECAYYALHPQERTDWMHRRKLWFEQTVVPAMRKVVSADPDYLRTIIAAFSDQVDVPARRSSAELRGLNEQE